MQKLLMVLIILLNTTIACADVPRIVVLGLFNGVAVIEINKKQHVLRVSEENIEGIKLLLANSKFAILEVNGVQEKYFLGSQVGSLFEPPEESVVTLWPTRGMYLTPGSINGYSVDFLIDTGASAIALNAFTAKRLGIEYSDGEEVAVKTAASLEKAYRINLDEVQVGQIKLYNVSALVLDGPEPARALLGMSFLGQLDMQRSGERMDLKQKF